MYDELVKGLREHSKRDNCNCDTCFAYDAEMRGYTTCSEELTEKAADAIEELQANVPRWISVTERLPQEREWVLCQCRAGIRMVLRLQNGYWHQDSRHEFMSGFVTHWMSLPEPPKEETE